MSEDFSPLAPESAKITALLKLTSAGDQAARAELFEAVLSELKRIAAARLRNERDGYPLQPTELVNLAYIRLADLREKVWTDRKHFFNLSSKIMYRVLVDMARQADALKRPGKWIAIPLDDSAARVECDADEILDISRALERLRGVDSRAATVIEYRFFSGLSTDEIAEELAVSTKTVTRDTEFGLVWMKREFHRRPGRVNPQPRT
jgi:RNA polymerase sigma factor (TIGR02999 family)